ncbi:hypothetical protein DEO72_LG2g2676 [Vigna unguiculata]|uniref:Uncharacterized protein n=1 Tax=Vigna unguiculata TaxID=3917 RepID=A0A4D6L1H7_VIGUN|nr:hypothetical protein DEO72_LG2g2676 [Vigna unguiculata]
MTLEELLHIEQHLLRNGTKSHWAKELHRRIHSWDWEYPRSLPSFRNKVAVGKPVAGLNPLRTMNDLIQARKVYPGQRFTRRQVACFQAGPAARKRSLSVLTWISGDGIRRPEATSSRGRSLALGDRLAVSLATTKRLPSTKDSFLSQQEDASLHLKELTRLTLPRLSQGLVSGSSSNLSHLSRMRGNSHVRFSGGRASRNHPIPIANIWSSI